MLPNTADGKTQDIHQVLGTSKKRSRRKILVLATLALAVIGVGIVTAMQYMPANDRATIQYKTAEIQRGNLTVKVSATGIVEPVTKVDIGTEISGTVRSVEVDFNSRVKAGQVLARINTDQLDARIRQSEAALALARARVKDAEATLIESRNKLDRSRELEKNGMCSKEQCDAAVATFARAEAELASNQAQVTQAQAALDADRNLVSKAVIRSPISGIVLKRQIEPGQTVAASLQTPILFTIAESLSQMQVHAWVDEADVGSVAEKQSATFTVDAFGERRFPATIKQIRYSPQTVQGVVTYETLLAVDNAELLLRPGMTASADITVKTLENVLLVPNAALRFSPPAAKPQTAESAGLVRSLFGGGRPPDTASKRKETPGNGPKTRIWTLRDGQPVAIPIKTGATNGQMTEVLKGEIEPGLSVLIDTITPRK